MPQGFFIELLRKRRSIRKYSPEKISQELIEIIIEASLRSPSARAINPWEFILVDDPELIFKLSQAKQNGSEFLKNAPFAIVVCADSSKTDFWIEDSSIAAIIIQLTASSLGLGSCWVQIRQRQHDTAKSAETYVQELLELPEHVKVESILGIGHPDEIKPTVSAENLQYEKIKQNIWS
jgi:nitroreductase